VIETSSVSFHAPAYADEISLYKYQNVALIIDL
jgi:hypothetical protein